MTDFLWAGGIEDTFIADPYPLTGRTLDEYELTRHYDLWKEDLKMVRDIGAQALRWGIPWYRVEPEKGHWDWRWTDEVIPYIADELGMTLIADLMHYGTPLWMPESFSDPDYPQRVTEYTEAFIERYDRYVRYVTPFNEPHTACRLCGQEGVWPPYRTGYTGYLDVFKGIVRGCQQQTRMLQEKGKQTVQVECSGGSFTDDAELEMTAELETLFQSMFFDFLTGKFDIIEKYMPFFYRNGISDNDLESFSSNAVSIGIMGINFYPQFNFRDIRRNGAGEIECADHPVWTDALERIMEERAERYGCPVMITETSVKNDEALKLEWLKASSDLVVRKRKEGFPVVGYTWFPLIDMYEWKYRLSDRPLSDFKAEFGMISMDRRMRDIASVYRSIIEKGV